MLSSTEAEKKENLTQPLCLPFQQVTSSTTTTQPTLKTTFTRSVEQPEPAPWVLPLPSSPLATQARPVSSSPSSARPTSPFLPSSRRWLLTAAVVVVGKRFLAQR
ncbi:hypothetical protein BCV69DRAFT_216489 [Microstroma glucosiphilum]|uniref:Uncharacterized protein n=1 Tax=Pseudomicrostroma glucosiphilum TaxID=1684307 RepID=A0A316U400_9BASI|nr:hypothetical protein BCV69DRAFT_216489 [Pseudomicrostroma glucosiphilum]PWN20022.1 hypothetical protein BCV69DRAFT_216489 [Pseudomicrostroma glucosiphilum]